METTNIDALKARLIKIYNRKKPPKGTELLPVIKEVVEILNHENEKIRPIDNEGLPGGLIILKKNIPTIIIPDLHARMDFFLNIIFYKDNEGISNIQKLTDNKLQMVCVGDGFHAESRAYKRWISAQEEFIEGYDHHINMDKEMKESFGLMEMVMLIKITFPDNFHFLKGNHENIANELGEGNYPFKKFALEGPMVLYYVSKFYGEDFLINYYIFEKKLPIFAVGKNFLISHAEPKKFFNKDEIINYKKNAEVIEGLTWTDDNQADADSVIKMLGYYLDNEGLDNYYYFGGHRPVKELYNKRSKGKYIQIHNPFKFIIAKINIDTDIILEHDVIELKNITKEIIQGDL